MTKILPLKNLKRLPLLVRVVVLYFLKAKDFLQRTQKAGSVTVVRMKFILAMVAVLILKNPCSTMIVTIIIAVVVITDIYVMFVKNAVESSVILKAEIMMIAITGTVITV